MKLSTHLRSRMMRYLASPAYLERQRARARSRRNRRGERPVVHYFHQVDDPYSQLAVQKLDALRRCYDVGFAPHLVSAPDAEYLGSAEHFAHWALRDAISVASHYGTAFAPGDDVDGTGPSPDAVAAANQALAAHLGHDDFAASAVEVGSALWSGQMPGSATDAAGARAVDAGNALQTRLGHYQGAMFYFDGEWFWGVDRLRLLEQRLIDEGYRRAPGELCVPQPTPETTTGASEVLLEYFPSLRSPYTAIGHQRVLDVIDRTGVSVSVRPVMPMMMRGIPAPRAKQRYIITDAAREGRAFGVPFGRIVDPFGEPVKRAFALYAAAAERGDAMAFVTAYLDAAWFDGVDITRPQGLAQAVASAGFDYDTLASAPTAVPWEAVLQTNLDTMLQEHLWGVPSFRVSGGDFEHAFACWGQDRIWRVEDEIARRR